MSTIQSKEQSASNDDADLSPLKSLEARIAKLEENRDKPLFKRITENVGAIALFLGLVLTVSSIYDVFVTKPRVDRINAISQFNQAVNSAARTRQESIRLQLETTDPNLRIAMAAAANPQVLNDIATARAMLRNLDDADVGIPQLIILITEAFNTGDLNSAGDFVGRAVNNADPSPYLRAEAKRYEGRYLFLTGRPAEGRQAFQSALDAVGGHQGASATSAYILLDLLLSEYALGDCATIADHVERFAEAVTSPGVPPQARLEMQTNARTQLAQMQGQHCPAVPNVDILLAG